MPNWINRIKITHLMTEKEDWESIQTSMTQIGNILERQPFFQGFKEKDRFKRIPHGDDFFKPVDYANYLIGEMYDYADQNRIWIE